MASRLEKIPLLTQRIILVIFLIFPLGLAIYTQIQHIVGNLDLYGTLLLAPLMIVFVGYMVYTLSSDKPGFGNTAFLLMIGFSIALRAVTLLIISTDLYSDVLDVHNYAIDIVRGMPTAHTDHYTYIPEATYLSMTGLTHAFFYMLFGASVKTAKLLTVVISAITCGLIYKLGKETSGDRRVGLVGGYLFAAWPALIAYTGIPTSEHIAMLLIVLFALISMVYSKSKERTEWRYAFGMYALMGAVIGLVDWYRPVGMILLLAFLVADVLYLGRSERKLRWVAQIAVLVITFLFVSQMAIQVNRWINRVPIPTNGQRLGHSILIGTNFESGGLHNWEDHGTISSAYKRFEGDFSAANRYLIGVAIDRVRENIDRLPQLIETKFRRVWQNDSDMFYAASVGSNDTELLGYAGLIDNFYLVFVTVLIFLVSFYAVIKRSPKEIFFMQIFFFGMALALLITEAQMRYRSILIPFSVVLAAMGLKQFLEHLRNTSYSRRVRVPV